MARHCRSKSRSNRAGSYPDQPALQFLTTPFAASPTSCFAAHSARNHCAYSSRHDSGSASSSASNSATLHDRVPSARSARGASSAGRPSEGGSSLGSTSSAAASASGVSSSAVADSHLRIAAWCPRPAAARFSVQPLVRQRLAVRLRLRHRVPAVDAAADRVRVDRRHPQRLAHHSRPLPLLRLRLRRVRRQAPVHVHVHQEPLPPSAPQRPRLDAPGARTGLPQPRRHFLRRRPQARPARVLGLLRVAVRVRLQQHQPSLRPRSQELRRPIRRQRPLGPLVLRRVRLQEHQTRRRRQPRQQRVPLRSGHGRRPSNGLSPISLTPRNAGTARGLVVVVHPNGLSRHNRPSSRAPPLPWPSRTPAGLFDNRPHCLKKNGTPRSRHSSRRSRTQFASIGRAD